MPKPIFCLMGPTASGKTELACALAQIFPFEVISVDSAMIYREMDIGTAKPSKEVCTETPHHLIDILDPPQSYSAAQFCTDARLLIDDLESRGKWPLLVGGTMMYFNALQQGLALLPQADKALRLQLEQQGKELGWPALHEELAGVDPSSAAQIHAHDSQRIQRALEVWYLTGQPLSILQAKTQELPSHHFHNLILVP